MMRQYLEIKEQNKDCILFFRLGDFYEMFFDDAKLVSGELEIVLTGRDCGLEERAPMCGVPYHSCESYIARLVEKGYKIGICPKQIVVHDTERRLNNKSIHTKNSYELTLLTDINKSYYYTFIKYHFQRMFIYLFRLNIKKFNSHRKLYLFAKNKEKQILDSIKQNKTKESSWL